MVISFAFSLLLTPFLMFLLAIIFLASIGKSLGVRRLYVKLLLALFEVSQLVKIEESCFKQLVSFVSQFESKLDQVSIYFYVNNINGSVLIKKTDFVISCNFLLRKVMFVSLFLVILQASNCVKRMEVIFFFFITLNRNKFNDTFP